MALPQETLSQLLEGVASFVKNRLRPLEEDVADAGELPADVIQEMKDMGLFGISIPQEYGGLGLTMEEEVLLTFELGHTSPAFRSIFGPNNGLGSQGILMDGTQEQKDFYLPRLASGEFIGSFCLTEPDSGSDAGSLRTKAVPDGDDYLISGTKRFITNAPMAQMYTVFARTNPDEKGARGVSAFIVPADAPGISLGQNYKKMGQHGTLVCDVTFDQVRVPARNIVGGPDKLHQGFKTAMKALDRGRLHISAYCVGNADRLINDSLKYATEREQFGQPIANFQLIGAQLADSKTEAYATRCMVLDAARKRDLGEDVAVLSACCKKFASEMVGRVADRAVQIHGGAGYVSEYGIERFYRDVRLYRIYEGTTEIQQSVIAKAMIREMAASHH